MVRSDSAGGRTFAPDRPVSRNPAKGIVRSRLDALRVPADARPPLVILGSGMAEVGGVGWCGVGRLSLTDGGPSVTGHPYTLEHVRIDGRPLLVQRGRRHRYEGVSPDEIVHGIRIAAELGTDRMLVTAAAGGIRTDLTPGSFMAVADVLDHQRRSFADLSHPVRFDSVRSEALHDVARSAGFVWSTGVYASVLGPAYETRAEIQMLRRLGADAVGMSLLPEVAEGVRQGWPVDAAVLITNRATGLARGPLDHAGVVETGRRAVAELTRVIEAWL